MFLLVFRAVSRCVSKLDLLLIPEPEILKRGNGCSIQGNESRRPLAGSDHPHQPEFYKNTLNDFSFKLKVAVCFQRGKNKKSPLCIKCQRDEFFLGSCNLQNLQKRKREILSFFGRCFLRRWQTEEINSPPCEIVKMCVSETIDQEQMVLSGRTRRHLRLEPIFAKCLILRLHIFATSSSGLSLESMST